jgi:hypothetical protein
MTAKEKILAEIAAYKTNTLKNCSAEQIYSMASEIAFVNSMWHFFNQSEDRLTQLIPTFLQNEIVYYDTTQWYACRHGILLGLWYAVNIDSGYHHNTPTELTEYLLSALTKIHKQRTEG